MAAIARIYALALYRSKANYGIITNKFKKTKAFQKSEGFGWNAFSLGRGN